IWILFTKVVAMVALAMVRTTTMVAQESTREIHMRLSGMNDTDDPRCSTWGRL
ncbi:hypothetical protein BGX31_000434, partial [Mortierella sp. GBA43]